MKTVVDCFGPADMHARLGAASEESRALFASLLGESPEEQARRIALMDPIHKIVPGRTYPPFLLLHGDSDSAVAYSQSEAMAQALCANDVRAELVRVEGAPHEGSFWSRELLALIEDFLNRTL